MYVGTALLAGRDPRPDETLAQVLFEARHILTHAVAYGVQAALLARSIDDPRLVDIVLLSVLIGAGQEGLQALLRGALWVGPSLFDLAVDALGAAVGAWVGIIGGANTPNKRRGHSLHDSRNHH